MTMPADIGAVDLMISFPVADHARTYDYLRPLLHDSGSGEMEMPAEYMFKDITNRLEQGDDPVDITLAEMTVELFLPADDATDAHLRIPRPPTALPPPR